MSASEKINNVQAQVQSHPTYLQAKDKTNYYISQLDKEASIPGSLSCLIAHFAS